MSEIEDSIAKIAEELGADRIKEPRFRESVGGRIRRTALGTAYAWSPKRIGLLPRITKLSLARAFRSKAERDRLPERPVYYSKRGLVGISNDLSVDALLANYSKGYFPVCHIGPMKWWCPEERAVINPAATHVGKNLRRLLRQNKFSISFDRDFAGVIEACARPRSGKVPLTWITPRVMQAFYDAHSAGYAHSVEVWTQEGKLAGGLYGISIGKVFFGESQFSSTEHGSKIAMVALHRHLSEWGFCVRDGKWMTPHLASFGFKSMPRAAFQTLIGAHLDESTAIGRWDFDPALDLSVWPPSPALPDPRKEAA